MKEIGGPRTSDNQLTLDLGPYEVIIDGKIVDCRTGYYELEDVWNSATAIWGKDNNGNIIDIKQRNAARTSRFNSGFAWTSTVQPQRKRSGFSEAVPPNDKI